MFTVWRKSGELAWPSHHCGGALSQMLLLKNWNWLKRWNISVLQNTVQQHHKQQGIPVQPSANILTMLILCACQHIHSEPPLLLKKTVLMNYNNPYDGNIYCMTCILAYIHFDFMPTCFHKYKIDFYFYSKPCRWRKKMLNTTLSCAWPLSKFIIPFSHFQKPPLTLCFAHI